VTGPTGPPEAELAQVADAHARLLAGVSALTDEQAAGPSLLPTWTRAEVLTHLARNADGTRRTVEGLLRGEVVAKYPGGAEQRSAEIAAGRGRPPSELVADLARSVEWLHDTWAAVPPEAWAPSAPDGTTAETARAGMWNRHREVEVHHVDLDLGYSPDDWPAAFTAQLLARTVGELAGRVAAELPPPDATWVLWADDLRLAWAVTVEAGSVELVAVSEVGRPDVLVRGAGRRLAAWLVGRLALDESGLAVAGNRVLAVGLPGWFPLR
jgi:maleylpyruvate isomerase